LSIILKVPSGGKLAEEGLKAKETAPETGGFVGALVTGGVLVGLVPLL